MPQKCQNKLKPKGMVYKTHKITISVNFKTKNFDALIKNEWLFEKFKKKLIFGWKRGFFFSRFMNTSIWIKYVFSTINPDSYELWNLSLQQSGWDEPMIN